MKDKDISGLVRENIRLLCPYSTARDEYKGRVDIFLDANESPYDSGFNRYPDPRQTELKEKLSLIKGIPVENIFLGNGSDEAIDLVYRLFCIPGRDNAVIISPSYGMYSVCARINDIEIREVPLGTDFSLSESDISDACDTRTKLIFLCSPNNPTGNAFSKETILHIADTVNAIVVADEAYADFSEVGSLRQEAVTRPNLIVLQTLSKAWGLAGVRLGMAFAQEYIIRLMSMTKYPYNIGQPSQRIVLHSLDSGIDRQVSEIVRERKRLASKLEQSPVVRKVFPSQANFLLVRVDDADRLYAHLLGEGIIVRNRNRVRGCEGCLRISIGLKEENDKLIKALEDYEKGDIRG